MKSLSWRWVLAISVFPLLGWWTYGLFDLDEGFYAAVATEMNLRGEWITPIFQGRPWYEKPILLYWLAKPSIAWFGDAVGPRLPSVLAAVGLYLLVGWFARRHLPDRAAKLSVMVLASSLLMIHIGKGMLTDSLLVLCFSAALMWFWESLVGASRWRLAAAAALGLSVLAKGPVTVVLFVAIAGLTFWLQPELRTSFRGSWAGGAIVFASVASTWYLPAYLAGGAEFVQKFLVEQNLGRFGGTDEAHNLDWWKGILFYPAVLLLGMFPWIELHLKPKLWVPTDRIERFLAIWAAAVLLLFVLSAAKLPHYIAPLLPPVALLIGRRISDRDGRWMAFGAAWTIAIGLIAQGIASWWYAKSGREEVHALAREARREGLPVAEYKLGSKANSEEDPTREMAPTGHPSVTLYLGGPPRKADSLGALTTLPRPSLVLAGEGQIEPADVAWLSQWGLRAVREPTVHQQRRYALWRLESMQ